MESLYKIGDDFRKIMDMEVETEEDCNALNELLGEVQGRFEEKAKRVALYRQEILVTANAISIEEDRLHNRRVALENKANALKDYLAREMELIGQNRIDTDLVTIMFQNNPPSVKVLDEKAIPSVYWTPQEPKLNKKAVLDAIKDGEQVPGAEMVQGKSLRIK